MACGGERHTLPSSAWNVLSPAVPTLAEEGGLLAQQGSHSGRSLGKRAGDEGQADPMSDCCLGPQIPREHSFPSVAGVGTIKQTGQAFLVTGLGPGVSEMSIMRPGTR